jgi:hypothetical protein
MSSMIFHIDLIDADVVANAFATSEQATYPVSNAYDLERRKRVWRSGGFWDLSANDRTIVFRETSMVDLTATIAASSYSLDSTLLAAIKAALEAAGAATYTVSRDTVTNRIKILSDGMGGGGIFQLMLTNAASADMAAVMGFDTSVDLTGALTYEADKLVIHTGERLTWDLGVPTNPTGFAAIGSTSQSPMKISSSAVVKLQGNWTNNWSAPAVEYILPFEDFIAAVCNEDGLANITYGYRFWSLSIVDPANTYGYVELGAIMLGIHLDISGCASFPFVPAYKDAADVAYSEGGQTFIKKNYMSQSFELNWQNLTRADAASLRDFFNYVGKNKAFFISIDPTDVIDSDGLNYFKLVRFEQDVSASLDTPGRWSMPWSLREEV